MGKNDLDLNGWMAAEAESMAVKSTDPKVGEDRMALAAWLALMAHDAGQAALAVAAANAEEWG